jgi:hypothetical protein
VTRRTTSYYESLTKLNERLVSLGKPPVVITLVPASPSRRRLAPVAGGSDRGWGARTRRSTLNPRLSRLDRERRGRGRASADPGQRCRGGSAHKPAMRGRRLQLLGLPAALGRSVLHEPRHKPHSAHAHLFPAQAALAKGTWPPPRDHGGGHLPRLPRRHRRLHAIVDARRRKA